MPIVLDGSNGITTPTYGGADTSEYLVPVTQFKNRIINGAMTIDQRNAGASVTLSSGTFAYLTDRFLFQYSQTSKLSAQQSTTAPAGFINSLLATSLAATSVGSGDYFQVSQRIEGLNVADLAWGTANAKTVTLSFWVRSSLTGTFGGALKNSAQNRSYPFTYVINASNTYEYKTITVAGDTTGTWLTTNGTGIEVVFSLGMGSTYSGTAGTWAGANYGSATGATSVVGTNGATFYITGVQLEVGSTATSFDYRPYGTELALCQRYFSKSSSTNVVAVNNTSHTSTGMFTSGVINTFSSGSAYSNWIKYPVSMRSEATTITFINTNLPGTGTSGQWSLYNGSAWVNSAATNAQASTTEGFNVQFTFTGTAYMYYGSWTASAEL